MELTITLSSDYKDSNATDSLKKKEHWHHSLSMISTM
jgi:hypothetical protein